MRRVEVRAGIEPTFADLQSAASPLCHRTPGSWSGWKNRGNPPVCGPAGHIAELSEVIQVVPLSLAYCPMSVPSPPLKGAASSTQAGGSRAQGLEMPLTSDMGEQWRPPRGDTRPGPTPHHRRGIRPKSPPPVRGGTWRRPPLRRQLYKGVRVVIVGAMPPLLIITPDRAGGSITDGRGAVTADFR